MELGRYRYVRIKANRVYCVKNTAQPTYHKHMRVRIKAGRGQAEFIQVPEMLTFIEDGSGWPDPREEAHSPLFPLLVRHKFNLNYNFCYPFICL